MPVPAIFVHVPKTGGTTLRDIIRRQYGGIEHALIFRAFNESDLHERITDELSSWSRPHGISTSLRVVSGHFIFGAHTHLPDRFRYLTMVREPVDRVISDYYYVRETPTHDLHDPVYTENYTLEDYVTSGITIYARNLQTRMLSGIGRDIPVDERPQEILDRAIENVEKHIPVVGLTNRFNESLILMKEAFQWTLPVYRTRNRTKKRLQRDEVGESTRNIIREYNALDLAFYEFASERLEKQIAAMDASRFDRDLWRLRWLNKAYAPTARAYIRFRQTVNAVAGRRVI